MGCNCGNRRTTTVYVLTYDDNRQGGEFGTRAEAEIADARRGGGGTIRTVQRPSPGS